MRDDQIEQFLTRQLYRLRLEHRWTQQRLALQAGLTRSTYAAIEVGNVRAHAVALWKIARALDCEVCELLPPAKYELPAKPSSLLSDHRTLFRFRELVDLSQASGAGLLSLKGQTVSFVTTFQVDPGQREILAQALLNAKQLDSWMVLYQRRSVYSVVLLLKQPKLDSWLKKLADAWLADAWLADAWLADAWLAEWLLRVFGD